MTDHLSQPSAEAVVALSKVARKLRESGRCRQMGLAPVGLPCLYAGTQVRPSCDWCKDAAEVDRVTGGGDA